MRKAAALGVVDFRSARLLDRKWWMRLNWLLEEVENEECKKLIGLKFTQHSSALNYLAGKTFDHHWKQLNELQARWTNFTFPWIAATRDSTSSGDSVKLWKAFCGDPSTDPNVQARVQETAQSLRNKRPGPSNHHPAAWERL